MKTQSIIMVILLGAAILMAACLSQVPAAPAVPQAPDQTPVRVAYLPIVSFGPVFIAMDEGYFARQGITVELVKFQSSATSLPALLNSDVDVSGGGLTPSLANAVTGGGRVRIVADKGRNAPGGSCNASGIMVRSDLVQDGIITKVADLNGRKIMVNGDQSYRLSKILKTGNLTTGDTEILTMDFASGVLALKNGAIDAADMTEPYVTQLQENNTAVLLFPTETFNPDFPTPLYYGPAFLDKNPELGKKFMVAYLQGARQYNEGKTDRNLVILANYTGLSRDLLNRSCWVPVDPTGDLPALPVRDYMDWIYANGKIPVNPPDDQLFDMSYVTYANSVLTDTPPAVAGIP